MTYPKAPPPPYQPLSDSPNSPPPTTSPQQLQLESPPNSNPTSTPTTGSVPPPSYDSIAPEDIYVEQPCPRRTRKSGKCRRFCLVCCSCYGIFCFISSIVFMSLLGLTVGYYASVVDVCINPPVTFETIEYINVADKHPNLQNLNIFVSVVSGAIHLETVEGLPDSTIVVKVIRGAGDQETVDEQTSFDIQYNETHLSLIGQTPTTLFGCPTVQIVVQVPAFESSPVQCILQAETGHIHIPEFVSPETDVQVRVRTGSVRIDHLVVNSVFVATNTGSISWSFGSSFIQGSTLLETNSGYIKVENVESPSSGSFQFKTNTGVINLNQISAFGQVYVGAIWGVVSLIDVTSTNGVIVNSDSAYVSLQNHWQSSVLSFKTVDGNLDLDHLSSMFSESEVSGMTTIGWEEDYFSGEQPKQYTVHTISGVVILYDL